MGNFYTSEQVEAAVDGCFKCNSSTTAIERLGCPAVPTLMKRVRTGKHWKKPAAPRRHGACEAGCACVAVRPDGTETCRAVAHRLSTGFDTAKNGCEHRHAKGFSYGRRTEAKGLIREVFKDGRQARGYRRRAESALEHADGACMSGKTVLEIARELKTEPLQRRRGHCGPCEKQAAPPEPNLSQRAACGRPASGATGFRIAGRKVCLSPLIDPFDGEVAGRPVATSPTVAFITEMMDGTEGKTPIRVNPAARTDQELRYRHKAYKNRLGEIGAAQGASRNTSYQGDAPAESFFSRLKSEPFCRRSLKVVGEFVREPNEYVCWCNRKRIRGDSGSTSPVEYRRCHQAMG